MLRGVFQPAIGTMAPVALALLLTPAGALQADAPRQRAAGELERLQERIGELRTTLGAARKREGDLRAALQQSEQAIARVSGTLRDLERQAAAQRAELHRLAERREALEVRLGAQRAGLAALVRSAHAMGHQEQMRLLLSQQDPGAVGRTLVYYGYLNPARAERIEGVARDLEALQALRAASARHQRELERLRERQSVEVQAREQQRAARAEVLAALTREIRAQGEELEGALADERRLRELLERLGRASARPKAPVPHGPFAAGKGQLPWPAEGRLAARFGAPRVGDLKWRGVLIAAPGGTDVHSIAPGRVAFADWMRGLGLLIIIDHGAGYMSLYGHNASLLRSVGDPVEAGEAIATVGDSGGQEQPGLYFEIRQNGQPVNPAAWCRSIPHEQG
jgi:murein hydrolase activator